MLLPEPDVLPPSVQALTAAEKEALATFRTLVTAPVDTVTAMWFIRARKTKTRAGVVEYDTAKSSSLYNAHLEWRKSYGADELIYKAPSASPAALAALNSTFAPKLLKTKDVKARPV
eukprot:2376157-Prymnesium_polylepis.1